MHKIRNNKIPRLALGLDSSTQSLSAVVIDISSRARVCQLAVDYRAEQSLRSTGIGEDYLLPATGDGDARQPVELYLNSLEILFSLLARELRSQGFSTADIAAINVSGQQHGHVLLGLKAESVFDSLNTAIPPEGPLAKILAPALALPWARIWRTADTASEAAVVRERIGGASRLIELSGSDGPLRFSAFGIRKTALRHPEAYRDTSLIHQISTLIPAVLTGRARIPLDWGNACGSSLMDYRARQWSRELLDAVARDLPAGTDGLLGKLPPLGSALTVAGTIARYFVDRHGFHSGCIVGIGSGDNPQSKALVAGSLLSLGTSFVIMAATVSPATDSRGYANAMYDSLDRPFCFGCRTNGALRWDEVRSLHGLASSNFQSAEDALAATAAGNESRLFAWHREAESFPPSRPAEAVRIGYSQPELAADYSGIVESSLASIYLNSRHFMAPGGVLFVTGGPSSNSQVLRRVAAIFNRDVVAVEQGGAALGAAGTAACLWLMEQGDAVDPGLYCASLLEHGRKFEPSPEDLRAYHDENGMVSRYKELEQQILLD